MGNSMFMYLILVHALLVKGIELESGKSQPTEVSDYHQPMTDFSISNKLVGLTFPTVFHSLI